MTTRYDENSAVGRSSWCQGCKWAWGREPRSRQIAQKKTLRDKSLKNMMEGTIYPGKEKQIHSLLISWCVSVAPFGGQWPSLTCLWSPTPSSGPVRADTQSILDGSMDEWTNEYLFHILSVGHCSGNKKFFRQSEGCWRRTERVEGKS